VVVLLHPPRLLGPHDPRPLRRLPDAAVIVDLPTCVWCRGRGWRHLRGPDGRFLSWWACLGCGGLCDFVTGAYVAPRRLN
jgi:hypothetical protein